MKPRIDRLSVETLEWSPVSSETSGLFERVMARDSEANVFSRLLRLAPQADTSASGPVVHDCWEEIYVLDGSMVDLALGERFDAGSYACRPPGVKHGPWLTEDGCIVLEVRYRAADRPAS